MHDWLSFLSPSLLSVLHKLFWGTVGVSGEVVGRKNERLLIIGSPESKGPVWVETQLPVGLQWLFLETQVRLSPAAGEPGFLGKFALPSAL